MNSNKLTLYFLFGLIFFVSCKPIDQNEIDHLFSSYQGESVPGAAVMVIRDGETVIVKTWGMANLEEKIPVETHTNFRLASVTKAFTAMCIMMLKERGKLDYETRLREILPDFSGNADKITIRHLLRHTSGLIAYESLMPDSVTRQVSDAEVLQLLMDADSTYFEPGSEFRYSNSGYAVLAMIVEAASGQAFADFLTDNIFEPLGMTNTVAFQKGVSTVTHRAFGYTVTADSVRFTDQSRTSAVLGDGGVYSSIDDLYKWDQALYSDKLVSQAAIQLAFTPGRGSYGFGWIVDEYQGYKRVYHTGGTRGFRTIIQRFPEVRTTIIILTNRSNPAVGELAERLADLQLKFEK